MKNYSELSDFEINKLVAIHRGHQCYYGNGSFTNDGLNVTVKGNGRIGWFNPCRLPEDAWEIIVENNIAIVPYSYTIPQAWPAKFGIASNFLVEDKNPLRAAMIVYLIMKES